MSKRTTRLLSLILTLVMFLSVATPAYAWGPGDFGGDWDRDIGDDEVRDLDVEVEEAEEAVKRTAKKSTSTARKAAAKKKAVDDEDADAE